MIMVLVLVVAVVVVIQQTVVVVVVVETSILHTQAHTRRHSSHTCRVEHGHSQKGKAVLVMLHGLVLFVLGLW